MKPLMLARHLFAVAVLPFTVTVLVPLWVARRAGVTAGPGGSAIQIAIQAIGLVVLGIGLLLFGASLRQFVVRGRGTLAPWDPPKHLVVNGPYRYVRNPMISGVVFILFGEVLILLSWPHAQWALLFLCINLVYIPLLEEPPLEQRFGGAYREYCRNVHRLVPRIRPWTPPERSSG
jgi:protein-S-isoprenylcysteine O-methyltransferase Ste14